MINNALNFGSKIRELASQSNTFTQITLATGVVVGSCLYLKSGKKRIFRKSKRTTDNINYALHIRRSFENLGLSLEKVDWAKIAENNRQIEELFKSHSNIIKQISYIKSKITKKKEGDDSIILTKQEEKFVKENNKADGVFYSLLQKYSMFVLREKRSIVV